MGARSGSRTPNVTLRAARRRLSLSQDDLADVLRTNGWTSCDRRTIQRYESGEVTRPRPFARRALMGLFGVTMAELGFSEYDEEVDDVNRRQLLMLTTAASITSAMDAAPDPVIGLSLNADAARGLTDPSADARAGAREMSGQTGEGGSDRREDLERRELIQALSVLGASVPAVAALRRIQSSVEAALGHDDSLDSMDVSDWEEVVAELGFSYVSEPPTVMLPQLATDLMAVRSSLARRRPGSPAQRDWSRVLAGLALLMAKTLSNLGRAREARGWWSTAQRACDASGDSSLGLWVNAERLFHGMYDNRPAAALLHRADEIEAQYPVTPSRGLAPIKTGKAQLLAMTCRQTEALAELRLAQAVYEQLPAEVTNGTESIAYLGADRLHYTETWIYAYQGNVSQLCEAAAKAHAAIPRTQQRAHTQLILLEAFGHTRGGDVSTGAELAGSAYGALPPEQHTSMVTRLAGMVLDSVPAGQQIEPSVKNYQELLIDVSRAQPRSIK